MKHLILLLLLTLSSTLAIGQLVDDFDDMSFPNDPAWQGDTDDFIVNGDGQLQLMAPGAGTSSVYSAISLEEDTTTFLLDFAMDFNPSGSNLLRVYLIADGPDLTTASGYYLQIGETGSEDAIRFFRQVAGESTELASGTLGAVANDPNVRLRVDAYPDGLWTVMADYSGGDALEEDIIVMDDVVALSSAAVHGYSMTYTAGRADAFFFDNVSIKPFELDKEPPVVLGATVLSPTQIQIRVNEAVTEASASSVANYTIAGVQPISAELTSPTTIILTVQGILQADAAFDVTVTGLSDEQGNVMADLYRQELSYARPPDVGDIVVNEIMFAPSANGDDYVEFRNVTDDFLDLSGYTIGNNTKTSGATSEIEGGTVLAPQQYVAFTENVDAVLTIYEPMDITRVVEQAIPDFNNDAGNVYLAKPDGSVLDSYDYDEDQHYELLSQVKGVSLERTSAQLPSDDAEAWYSASREVNYGTPGYVNSASLEPRPMDQEEELQFITKVFTPDGDNFDDRMVLSYELDKPGYVADVEIRDTGGFLIDRVKTNESLSASGLITWDGLDIEGKVANIGMYIIIGQLFHADGEIIPIKKVCVLAGVFE